MKEGRRTSHPGAWRLIGGGSPRAGRHNAAVELTIREAAAGDDGAIGEVHDAAFGEPSESILVERLRTSSSFLPGLSLVAEVDARVVGHVMVTTAWVDDGTRRRPVANLSPLGVSPELQGQGVGSALVREVLIRTDARGEPLVVLQGSPTYYRRFGFEWSVPLGITMALPDWAPREAAQVRKLAAYEPTIRGDVVLPEAFDGL